MNEETKKRIAEINSGIIPKGYKKTKVGIVPVEWENTIFSEIFEEKNEHTNDLEKYPLYSLTIEEGVIPKSEKYERGHLVKKDDLFKVVYPNDYVYNPMNVRFGALARHKGNFPVSVSGYYDVFSVKNNYSMEYMDNFLLSVPMINYYNKNSTGSLKEKQRVHFSQFITFNLPIPPLAEQQKIAEILTEQDKLISLLEKKIEKLKEMKKAYLQKMFPKKNEKYPEIRFSGFTGDWEQRKFGNVFEEYSEKNHEELPPLTIIQGKGTILRDESDRNLIYDKAGLKNYKLVNKNDFILHLRSFEGGLEVANSKGIVSPAYHIFHGENVDTGFYYPFFRSKFFISVLLKPHVYGIRDGKSIDVDGMKTIQIPYPKIEEQQAIGNYFKSLDNLINLNQRKLEKEKEKKKALMQLLLTGKVRVKL